MFENPVNPDPGALMQDQVFPLPDQDVHAAWPRVLLASAVLALAYPVQEMVGTSNSAPCAEVKPMGPVHLRS